jgi:hypothetical protein
LIFTRENKTKKPEQLKAALVFENDERGLLTRRSRQFLRYHLIPTFRWCHFGDVQMWPIGHILLTMPGMDNATGFPFTQPSQPTAVSPPSGSSAPKVKDCCNALRSEIKAVATHVTELKKSLVSGHWAKPEGAVPDVGEALANVTLCYRHLEDAAMRLGKTIQAWDGGKSIYDK